MTHEKVRRTVTATVAGKGSWKGQPSLHLDIPEFKSNFPITFNRWPEGFRDSIEEGETIKVVLTRENLKAGKTGQYDTDYWWAIVDAPTTPAEKQAPSPTAVHETATPDPQLRQNQIMLQHATGVAGALYPHWRRMTVEFGEEMGTFGDWLKAVAQGATWLLRAVYQPVGYPATAPAPAEARRPVSATHSPTVPTGQGGEPMPEDDDPPF